MSSSVTSADIRAAGGFEKWKRREVAKGRKKALAKPGSKPRVEPSALPAEWLPLLNTPGVTRCKRTDPPNKWESQHADNLGWRVLDKEIKGFLYEAFTLELAPRCTYTPDFFVLENDGSYTAHEVKGFMRDDAAVKLKVAAGMYPQFRFELWRKNKRGEWKSRVVPAAICPPAQNGAGGDRQEGLG